MTKKTKAVDIPAHLRPVLQAAAKNLLHHLYGCDGHGPANCPLVCLDTKTGEEKWRTEPDLSEEITTPEGQKRKVRLNPDRCHLQITGVYSFPDYLDGKCFADFSPKPRNATPDVEMPF